MVNWLARFPRIAFLDRRFHRMAARIHPSLAARTMQPSALDAAWRALGAPACRIEAVERTGSTNADLMARAREAAPETPWLLTAESQTAGRGRLGRVWHTSPGDALLLSVALRLRQQSALAPLTLACGVAVAEALQAAGVAVRLKWPNDVLLEGRKLAGILAELALDARGARTVVLGIGLNLALSSESRACIGQPAAALAEVLDGPALRTERAQWIARVGAAALQALMTFDCHGFAPFHARFERLLAWRGQRVVLEENGQAPVEGVLEGVDAFGRLRVTTPLGERSFHSGELSVRALAAT
jgi:BirA family transcriptional regulator, biotin operon repressor / biotin---[acetyl-CoA-carboxylase] ligase